MARQKPNNLLTVLWTVTLACPLYSACSDSETSRNALQVAASNKQSDEPNVPNVAVQRTGAPKVAFLGDSIASGQFLSEQQAFPSVVQRRLTNISVVNVSVPTDTTADGLRRIDWLIRQQPAVVVVALGENDKRQAVPVGEV